MIEESKNRIIHAILKEHILNENYYRATFDAFHKEYDINLFESITYQQEVDVYQKQLTNKLALFIDKVYSSDDLTQMFQDNNSSLYYRMLTQEYKDIIHIETTIFATDLKNKFVQNCVPKKTFWNTLKKFLGL